MTTYMKKGVKMIATTEGKSVLRRYVSALQAGDTETVRDLFAEDATWTLAAEDLPIAGTREGRDAIVDDFLATARSYFEPNSIEIEITGMTAEDDRVVLQWTSRARVRSGGDVRERLHRRLHRAQRPHPLGARVHGHALCQQHGLWRRGQRKERAMTHRVIVVGGGFGGLWAVRALKRAPVEVTLVDRQNFHLFQPLAYQVATGALSPAEIAVPLRSLLKRQANVRVLLGEVVGFDLERRDVILDGLPNGGHANRLGYDTLVVAGGSHYSYFGHDEWARSAPELKSLRGALEIRERILSAFEAAEVEDDPTRRRSWLTFVVVGGGPTGVEMAGQIAEIARDTLRRDYRSADTRAARVLLVEAGDRVLRTFPPSLSRKAERELEQLGVTPVLGHTVVGVTGESVVIQSSDGHVEQVDARTAVWAAGVHASELAAMLDQETAAGIDRAGRVTVGPDLTLPGHPEVFAIGDMVAVHATDGTEIPLPGLAPVAMQQGNYVARIIRNRLKGRSSPAFRYRDKGNLATIGRSRAVAEIKGIRLAGFPAWVLWLGVHLFFLIGFQNRLLVLLRWTISFVTHGRGARLVIGPVSQESPAPRLQD